jgi:alkyl hydroperoxide reductase subunit AhpC
MPEIEAVYQEHKDKDVVVIGVDILVSEILRGYDENDVFQYVQQGGYSWTFVLDTTGEVAASYNVTAIPTIFFIDKDGIIQVVNIGAMNKRAMESKLAEAMR